MTAPAGLATAILAIALLAVPAARAGDARDLAGQAIYHALGAMIVEGATNTDDVPYYLKQDDRSFFQEEGIDIPTSIPHDKYSATDDISNPGFNPEEGITCFPQQGLCFKKSGQVDMKWTDRIYAN